MIKRKSDKEEEWEELDEWLRKEHQAIEINPIVKKWFREIVGIMSEDMDWEKEEGKNEVVIKKARLLISGIPYSSNGKNWEKLTIETVIKIFDIVKRKQLEEEKKVMKEVMILGIEEITKIMGRKNWKVPMRIVKKLGDWEKCVTNNEDTEMIGNEIVEMMKEYRRKWNESLEEEFEKLCKRWKWSIEEKERNPDKLIEYFESLRENPNFRKNVNEFRKQVIQVWEEDCETIDIIY